MKFEIEKQFRPILGKFQFYVYADGENLSVSFDTEKEAEQLCDKMAAIGILKERTVYVPETEDEKTERHTSLELNND